MCAVRQSLLIHITIVKVMNVNFKPRSKIDLQPTRPLKKADQSRRLYTEAYDEHDFGQTYKRINLYLNKNPLNDINKTHNADKKSKGQSNSHFNKTGSRMKQPLSKDKKSTSKPSKTMVTEPYEKKSMHFSKAQSRLVDQLFPRQRKLPSQKEVHKEPSVLPSKKTTNVTTGTTSLSGASKYSYDEVVGSGTFGVVYKGRNKQTLDVVAIKKVLQDPKYKNRQYEILKELNHPNVLKMKDAFFTSQKNQQYLNVIMDYFPETAYSIIKKHSRKNPIPEALIKIYSYQMFRSLMYLTKISICHRDIKPHNILIDPKTNLLVMCDFGSAKRLVKGEPNISYICSRCYRAPELIFGATEYTNQIDMWSVGCVIVEMLIFQPLFMAESNIDQLVEIIRVLGTPSENEVLAMNPKYDMQQFSFPKINARDWKKVVRQKADPLLLSLINKVMKYDPTERLSPYQALLHPYFDELRDQKSFKALCKKYSIPDLFDFTQLECKQEELKNLIPSWEFEG